MVFYGVVLGGKHGEQEKNPPTRTRTKPKLSSVESSARPGLKFIPRPHSWEVSSLIPRT